ncbi:MAG TPA: phosphatase PAP2 family protein [Thermomicrobiales bacterium]|nr:phosphatase PAP2 family protein [Thermomicrobiales bacterium]
MLSTRRRADSYVDRHPLQFNPDRLARARGTQGFIIAAVAMAAFSVVFVLVRKNRSAATDAAITLRLQKRDHPYFDRLMRIVSWPGFPPQSRLLPPSIAAALWMLGLRVEAVFQLMAWGTGAISFTFKRIMQRPRPSKDHPRIKVAVANIGGTSFPSGHVINYMGVYGFLAFLAHTWIRPTIIRRAVVGFLVSLLSLVGMSRVYLGHHWFTDVVASYLLGTTWLVGLTSIYRRVKLWTLRNGR